MISFNIQGALTSFIFLQVFGTESDQRAPFRDIFKSIFLANAVSERSTISLSIIVYDWSRKIPRPLLHIRIGGGEGGWHCRRFNGRLIPIGCLLFSAFFFFKLVKSVFQPLFLRILPQWFMIPTRIFFHIHYRVSFNHSRLSTYKSEATIFGLAEIRDNPLVCFHRVISHHSFVFSRTSLITLLDYLLLLKLVF